MEAALLIIDVQQALCSGDDSAHDVEGVVERINAASARARAAGVPVVAIQHEDDGPLNRGSAGWQFAAGLHVEASDLVVAKTACDAFHRTDLQALLEARGVKQLVVCGLHTDYCVDTTVRRALALGYPVQLLADAHSTVDNGVIDARAIIDHHNATLSRMRSFGPRVTLVPAAAAFT